MTHILIVDDDTELSEMLGEYLRAEGFTIECSFDGESGVLQALSNQFDAVILDVMLPRLNGFDALKRIRSQSNVPIIMLTAKGDDVDKIVGLEIGADDYLPKPFNPRELLARLNAVLRRCHTGYNAENNEETGILSIGLLEVHPSSRTAFIEGVPLNLTSTEFNLLHALIKQAGTVVSKASLSENAMGRSLEKYDRSIDMHMSNLRTKMSELGQGSLILTIRGHGYQLAMDK